MKYLLDTHAILWFLDDDPQLSKKARKLTADSKNIIYVSTASFWEMTIKASLGKLQISSIEDVFNQCINYDFELLDIKIEHLSILGSLKFHHRDPFDRTLISQAISEKINFITRDLVIGKYSVNTVW